MVDCAMASDHAGVHSSSGQWPDATLNQTLEVVDAPSSISETSRLSLIKAAPKLNRHSRNISTTSSTKTPVLSATITSLIDEPLFYSTFLSDTITPTAEHKIMSSESIFSFQSAVSHTDDVEMSFPELLEEDAGYVDQQCVYAQAVHIVAHGPPKVLELMRVEKPTFKRASQIYLSRPAQRPAISPIQTRMSRPARRSVSSVASDSSMSSGDRKTESTQRSQPTTPVLESDEPLSPSSEDSPMTPGTPKSSFERENSISALPSKENFENGSSAASSLKSHVRMPSRLRLFPRRTSSATDTSKALPITPPLTPEATTQTTTFSRPKFFARGASEREPLLELPPSPTRAEAPTKPAPRSIWKEANTPKSKSRGGLHKIRRVESKIGLNIR